MRINHNSMALNASDHFASLNSKIAKSMKRLSSGYKISSPADDAAGLAISTQLDAQVRGLKRAALNTNDGISVIQTSEGGLDEMHAVLGRMRELATKAANDINFEEDRDAIQEEINALAAELDQIAGTTAFNGEKLLNGNLTRRSLSSEMGIGATYIAPDVLPGVYKLSIDSAATQAEMTTGSSKTASGTVTKDQAGSVMVNGFEVQVTEGMDMTEVYETFQAHLTKIGIDVMDDGKFVSREYGSSQKIEISCGNADLASLLGITDGASEKGTDCTATLTTSEKGFTDTATYTTDGNKVKIIDRKGFEMDVEAEPGKTGETEIEVMTAGPMVIQIGANSGEQIALDIPRVDANGLGVDKLIMYTHDYAAKAIEAIDAATEKVSSIRSKLGAYQNRLEDISDSLGIQEESITEAYSRIMDTDMAEELTEYTQYDVLSQAAISMMQKANERPESILQLLQ